MAIDTVSLFTPASMARVDQAAIDSGLPGTVLMERAGRSVARVCQAARGPGKAVVLCGPGNNGGDGIVAGHYLQQWGWNVTLVCLADKAEMTGDGKWAADTFGADLDTVALRQFQQHNCDVDVVIDALFGAGLTRPLERFVADTLTDLLGEADISIAVDLPSGVSGENGEDLGGIYTPAGKTFDHTVTFGGRKFGHVVQPGQSVCGTVWVADIGLPSAALQEEASGYVVEARMPRWLQATVPTAQSHKYKRGHVGVLAGPMPRAGAAQLAASASIRAGAGLVTLITQGEAAETPASTLKALMQAHVNAARHLPEACEERKISQLVAGPGLGLGAEATAATDQLLGLALPAVLDADCLSIIARERWQRRLRSHHVITPHEGEFARLFPGLTSRPRLDQLKAATDMCDAAVCLKGPDTVIGRGGAMPLVNAGAPAWLATAGSGDVLAGIIGALLNAGDPAEATAGGVFLHTKAAKLVGPGLVADDLVEVLPACWAALLSAKGQVRAVTF